MSVSKKQKASSHPIQDRLVEIDHEQDRGVQKPSSSGIEVPAFRAV
jgi:hypothetical protein